MVDFLMLVNIKLNINFWVLVDIKNFGKIGRGYIGL